MEKNSTKSLKWLTGVVAVVGIMAVVGLAAQTLGFFIGNSIQKEAVWIPNFEILQGTIAILRFLAGVTLIVTLIIFMLNSIKGLNNGTLFPRKNISILFCAAASSFLFLFCNSNVNLILGESVIHLDFGEIFAPALICTFAIIYRIAVQVSEENSLTI